MPLTKLCAWFGVPRRTVYYQPTSGLTETLGSEASRRSIHSFNSLWADLPRHLGSNVSGRATRAAPKVDPRFAEPIKAMIEREPSFGYRIERKVALVLREKMQ